jgi:hypothetical protein
MMTGRLAARSPRGEPEVVFRGPWMRSCDGAGVVSRRGRPFCGRPDVWLKSGGQDHGNEKV